MVTAKDLQEHATVVVVGYGIDASVCHQAERIITTSERQMHLTEQTLQMRTVLCPK
nr:hypothetical protein [Corynebacterium silvaticum]